MKAMHMTGLSQTRIYRIWIGMKARCYNPNSVPYPYYGAKGIVVCDEWLESGEGFMNFYYWSMSHGYSDDLTIDRLDSSGNYCPSNCRWTDRYHQNINLSTRPNESGYIGISKHNNCDTWYGRVKVYGKCIYTGTADSPLEAAKMRDRYIVEHNLDNKLNGVLGDESI